MLKYYLWNAMIKQHIFNREKKEDITNWFICERIVYLRSLLLSSGVKVITHLSVHSASILYFIF